MQHLKKGLFFTTHSLTSFSQGLIGGIGASLIHLPANIATNYYFDTKRALASGITRCGSST